MVEHQNLVGMNNGRKPMRNHDGCPIRHQMLEGFLDQSLRGSPMLAVASSRIRSADPSTKLERLRAAAFSHTQFYPRSPTTLSQLIGQRSDERAFAATMARQSSPSVASGFPSADLRIVPLNKKLSWVTTPTASRKSRRILNRFSIDVYLTNVEFIKSPQ